MIHQPMRQADPAVSSSAAESHALFAVLHTLAGNAVNSRPAYKIDALRRRSLFARLLRKRSNGETEFTSRSNAAVRSASPTSRADRCRHARMT